MKTVFATLLAFSMLTAMTAFACEDGHKGEFRKLRKSGELSKEERQVLREDFQKHKELRKKLREDGELSEQDREQLKASREELRKHMQELASNEQKREKKGEDRKQ